MIIHNIVKYTPKGTYHPSEVGQLLLWKIDAELDEESAEDIVRSNLGKELIKAMFL